MGKPSESIDQLAIQNRRSKGHVAEFLQSPIHRDVAIRGTRLHDPQSIPEENLRRRVLFAVGRFANGSWAMPARWQAAVQMDSANKF